MKRSGWLTFAAVVLIAAGIMRIFDAIWAFSYNGTVVNKLHGAIFGHSLTTYGVIWLIVGIVSVVAGYLVMKPGTLGAEAARRVGRAVAAIGAILAVTWMPYFPVWSLVYVGLGILVIYALLVHSDQEVTTD
jgi:hypothetical protein